MGLKGMSILHSDHPCSDIGHSIAVRVDIRVADNPNVQVHHPRLVWTVATLPEFGEDTTHLLDYMSCAADRVFELAPKGMENDGQASVVDDEFLFRILSLRVAGLPRTPPSTTNKTVLYPEFSACPKVDCACTRSLQRKGAVCKADVWNGCTRECIEHGRKRCRTCGTSFRLSFHTAGTSCKTGTLRKNEFEFEGPERIILLESYLGFTLSNLRQLHFRFFRSAVSCIGEAYTICETFAGRCPISEKQVVFWSLKGMKLHQRREEGIFDRDINDVVPRGDTCHDANNLGFHTVFNAWRDDPEYVNIKNNVSIVTDGHKVLTRAVKDPSESAFKKRGCGRPREGSTPMSEFFFFGAVRLR